MATRIRFLVVVLATACGGDQTGDAVDPAAEQQRILEANDAMIAAMVAGRSTADLQTGEWQGVNLNGTPMSAAGFEGEDRVMVYDSILVLDRDVRIYGETAALRWHANFFVNVNGNPSFAEMRLLELYVLRDDRWLLDLTQVTPVYGTVGNPPGS